MDLAEPSKQIVRVTIFNQTYSVSAPGNPAATEDLAQSVDELMSSIARRAGNLDTARTAVLACLHLADRLRSTEEALESLRDAVSQKSRDLSRALDQAFASPSSEISYAAESPATPSVSHQELTQNSHLGSPADR